MDMTDEETCGCGGDSEAKIFLVGEFQIRGYECRKCGKTYLNGEDVARYAEYRKGLNVAERVVC
jgi:hypothetical protein